MTGTITDLEVSEDLFEHKQWPESTLKNQKQGNYQVSACRLKKKNTTLAVYLNKNLPSPFQPKREKGVKKKKKKRYGRKIRKEKETETERRNKNTIMDHKGSGAGENDRQ